MVRHMYTRTRIITIALCAIVLGSVLSFTSPQHVMAGSIIGMDQDIMHAMMPAACGTHDCAETSACSQHCYEASGHHTFFAKLPSFQERTQKISSCVIGEQRLCIALPLGFFVLASDTIVPSLHLLKTIIKRE